MTPAESAAIDAWVAQMMRTAPTAADIRRADPARYARLVALLRPVHTAPVPARRTPAA